MTNDIQSETAGEIGSNQMGTEEYSDFDSDSGEEWLNDMRENKEETEETATSTNEPEKTQDMGKYNKRPGYKNRINVEQDFLPELYSHQNSFNHET